MENLKAVIFDMDGILLDTESVCKVCWRRAAKDYEIENIDSAYVECIGQNTNATLEVLKKYCKNKVEPKTFYDRTSELFHIVEREEGLKKMPFAKECLESLKKMNIRMAVASSTRWESVERQLKAAELFDYFETITTGDKVLHSKPAPDIYLKAIESLNLKKEECIAVEDSFNGIISATSAGLRCVMVPDQLQPTEEIKKITWNIIKSLNELPNLIK